MSLFVPSIQQTAIFNWTKTGNGSAFVRAAAGAGKTTTLVKACALMTGTSVAFLAFNKKIAVEIQERVAAAGLDNVRAGTFHSFGLKAVKSIYKRTKPEAKIKNDKIFERLTVQETRDLETVLEKDTKKQFLWDNRQFIFGLLSMAKQKALGVFGHVDDIKLWWDIIDHHDMLSVAKNADQAEYLIRLAQEALRLSNAMVADLIDFDDMIYIPVLKGLKVQQFDWVLVDEAQDTNPARRALARMMLKTGGRAMFVGDERQSIYGFAGADADAIAQIRSEFNTVDLPLTVTYRCPKLVVAMAQDFVGVDHITAHESAPEGTIGYLQYDQMMKSAFTANDAILCRNTKPIVQAAFNLIRAGVACHVEGRDIGAALLRLANRWKSITTIPELRDRLEDYKDAESKKLIAKNRNSQAENLVDQVNALIFLLNNCSTIGELKDLIDSMFTDSEGNRKPTLILSTIHKAKGREWNRVFILGYDTLMPSRWAKQAWEKEQETNLQYVAYTRSKSELVLVSLPVKANTNDEEEREAA